MERQSQKWKHKENSWETYLDIRINWEVGRKKGWCLFFFFKRFKQLWKNKTHLLDEPLFLPTAVQWIWTCWMWFFSTCAKATSCTAVYRSFFQPPPPVGKVTTPAVKKVQDVSLMHPFHGHAQCLGGINVFACTVTAALWRLCSLCEKPEANGSKEYADIFGAELKFREKKDIAHFSGAVLTYACTWTLLTFVAFNRWHLWIHSVCLQVQNDGHSL